MRKKAHKPEDITSILRKVIGKIEKENCGRKEKILAAWKKTAGEKAAGHSRPVSIRRKILTIEVDSSGWLYELNLKKQTLLKDVRRELKTEKVEKIRFRMGEIT